LYTIKVADVVFGLISRNLPRDAYSLSPLLPLFRRAVVTKTTKVDELGSTERTDRAVDRRTATSSSNPLVGQAHAPGRRRL
jgi:hypothetical protein